MGKEFQKSALPTLFHFVWVRAAFQPHVSCYGNILSRVKLTALLIGIRKFNNFSFALKTLMLHSLLTHLQVKKGRMKTNMQSRMHFFGLEKGASIKDV